MDYINYLTLMMLGVIFGLVLGGTYLVKGIQFEKQSQWIPGFLITGILTFFPALRMIYVWPLPGSHNILFGEPVVLFGAIFLVAALVIYKQWSLFYLAAFVFLAGLVTLLLGIRVMSLGLTDYPSLAGVGYLFTAIAALLTPFSVKSPDNRGLINLNSAIAYLAALIWLFIVLIAYWNHLSEFSEWSPEDSISFF